MKQNTILDPQAAEFFAKKAFNQFPIDRMKIIKKTMNLGDCRTLEAVRTSLHRLCENLGFEKFSYIGNFVVDGESGQEQVVSNYDDSYLRKQPLSYALTDPTALYAESNLVPLIWPEALHATLSDLKFKNLCLQCETCTGVTFPIHRRSGDVGRLNLSICNPRTEPRHHIEQMLTWGPLIASVTHDIMYKLILAKRTMEHPKITKRECEILKWLQIYKTTWEMSQILGISTHGVIFHVRNILRKLNATNRQQAVAKAISYGIL